MARHDKSLIGKLRDRAVGIKDAAVGAAKRFAGVAVNTADTVATTAVDKIARERAAFEEVLASKTFTPASEPLVTTATRPIDWTPGQPFRVLSMDGAAGVLQYTRLMRDLVTHIYLENPHEFPGFLRHIHLIAGNSGGTLAGLYLARRLNELGRPPTGAEEVAILDDLVVFVDGFFDACAGSPAAVRTTIKGQQPVSDNVEFTAFLEESYTKDLRLGDCQTPALDILSLRLYNGGKVMNYFSPELCAESSNAESNPTLVQLGLRSSAFPVCFPMSEGHADGALIANNPSLQAVCRLMAAGREGNPNYLKGLKLEDIRLLSLGAEKTWLDRGIELQTKESGIPADEHWGWLKWIGPLARDVFDKPPAPTDIPKLVEQIKRESAQVVLLGEAFCDGVGKGAHEGCRNLLGDEVVFRLAVPTRYGLICDAILWWLGDSKASPNAAAERAKEWRENPDDTKYIVSFNQTLAWLKTQWIPETTAQ